MIKINRIGQKFGRLLILNKEESERRKDGNGTFTIVRCVCDCGKLITTRLNGLVCGNQRSCGCLKKENHQSQPKHPKSVSGMMRVYRGYKFASTNKGREFNLTVDQFKEITQKNCHYCGVKPEKIMSTGTLHSNYVYNGIDRKDNNIGYIYTNCLPCCETCNKAKHTKSYEDFLLWISNLTTFRGK